MSNLILIDWFLYKYCCSANNFISQNSDDVFVVLQLEVIKYQIPLIPAKRTEVVHLLLLYSGVV